MPPGRQTTLANILECYKEHRVWTLMLNVTVCLQLGHKPLTGMTLITKIGHNLRRTPGTGPGPWCLCSRGPLWALIAGCIWDWPGSAAIQKGLELRAEAV